VQLHEGGVIEVELFRRGFSFQEGLQSVNAVHQGAIQLGQLLIFFPIHGQVSLHDGKLEVFGLKQSLEV
jgi:hypothetical protein